MEEKELQNSQICNLCGQVFKNESQLSQHCLIHQARRLYPCTVCRKSFTLEANLEQHVLIHEGIKPYACTSCDKTFTHKSHMEEHALIHIGIKPYICDTCEKGFTLQSSLARHSLIHRGLKRHRCSVCGKEFARKTHLSQHSITHTGVKPHVCNICGRGFTTKGNMKKHTLLHGERSKTSAVDQVAGNPLVCAERGESYSRKGIQPKEHRSFHEDDDVADSSTEEKAHGRLPKGELGLAGSDSLTAFSGSGNSIKVEEPYSQEGQDSCNFVGIKSEYDEQYLENYDAS